MRVSIATVSLAALVIVSAPPLAAARDSVGGLQVDPTPVEPGTTLGVVGEGFARPSRCEVQAFDREWDCRLGSDGASGAITVGTHVEPGSYLVRLCVPDCDQPWAGVASAPLAVEEPGGEDPGGEDPGDEDPGGEDPGGEDPGDEDPGGEDPGGEDPGGEDPGDEDPGDEDPGDEDPGDEDPEVGTSGSGNQAFLVTPTDRAVLPTPTGGLSSRAYLAAVPEGTVVAIQLFPAPVVQVSAGRVLISTGDTGPATSAPRVRTPAGIVVVNGSPVVGTSFVRGVVSLGAVTFTISGSPTTEVVPVVFADEDGDGALDLGPAEPGGVAEPTEPVGVGGAVAFTADAAPEERSQGVPSGTVQPVTAPVRLLVLAATEEPLRLSPARTEPGGTVHALTELPSTAALRRCELRWAAVDVGARCEVDEDGRLTGSLSVPSDATNGLHEITACYPTCSSPSAERRVRLVPVRAPAEVPRRDDTAPPAGSVPPQGTASDWLTTLRAAAASVPVWGWALLVAGLALLTGVGASLARTLWHPPAAKLVPVPDPDPEVRTEVLVPAQRMPTLRLQAVPDERPITVTEVER